MPYISVAVRCNIMKRRTFLRLSSATLAALGLSACGAETAVSSSYITDDASNDTSSIGMTLEQAQEYSQNHDKLFLLRPDGRFYPLLTAANRTNTNRWNEQYNAVLIDDISFYESYLYGINSLMDEITGSSTFSDGELVYISLDSLPNTIDFIPISDTIITLPVTFRQHKFEASGYQQAEVFPIQTIQTLGGRYFSDYDSSYIAVSRASESLLTSGSGISNLTINGLSPQDYCDKNSMLPVYVNNHSGDISTDFIVDLSDFVDYDTAQLKNGHLALSENNDQNTVVIEYYESTQYHSITLSANCLAFFFDSSEAISCPVTPTKGGYAIVDTSSLTAASSGSSVEYFAAAYAPDDTAFSVIGLLS